MKLAALQRGISRWNRKSSAQIDATYINTGQHYDDQLAGALIRELGIKLDYEYSYESLKPINIFADMIVKLQETLDHLSQERQIDWLVLFGDADTTLAGAIAGSRVSCPIVHIEAGARTGDRRSQEEANRILTDHLATVHFVSSKRDLESLAKEGLTRYVIWSGDILYDFVKGYAYPLRPGYATYSLGEYVLASIHHQENLQYDETMENILMALDGQSRQVLFVTHPRTRKKLQELGLLSLDNIQFLPALAYGQMMSALKGCAFVFTDSGGLQREAYYLRKRGVVRQDSPFWPSLTLAGIHRAVGTDLSEIQEGLKWVETVLESSEYPIIDDFGNGNAVDLILQNIVRLTTLLSSGREITNRR